MHKICGFYIIYFSIELKIGSSNTRCVFFSLWLLLLIVTTFSIFWLQFFLSIMLGHFFFLTMTRKPTRLTHINATINRHDVMHPSEKSFATVHRVRLDLACHSFSTEVKGFLLKNFHFLANQGILFTAYPAADAQFFTLVKLNETSGVVLANVCEVYACATTLLSFLWRNISNPRATVFPISRCMVWGWLYAVEPTSNRSSVKWGFSCS